MERRFRHIVVATAHPPIHSEEHEELFSDLRSRIEALASEEKYQKIKPKVS